MSKPLAEKLAELPPEERQRVEARARELRAEMTCPKHGCQMTTTITEEVFCGVCERHRLRTALERIMGMTDPPDPIYYEAYEAVYPRDQATGDQYG